MVGCKDFFKPFISGGDLLITRGGEVKVWVDAPIKMLTWYNMLNMGEKLL